ncbi:MAG: hypothetical protein HY918_04010 [Candidatus Doudnabacteria bacterium]|nr:hypothetical protein [Candidatus Doudnabacteria bacterium]
MKNKILKTLLILAALLPVIRWSQDGISSILIFSVFVLILLWSGLRLTLAKLPLPLGLAYIFWGVVFGGLTQWFVQIEGFEKSFSQNPIHHFIQALTIYFWVVVAWYYMLKKYDFSSWAVFWVTGLWGVLFEGILLYGAFNPLIWLFIFMVYGSFSTIPFLLTQDQLAALPRPMPNSKNYATMFALLGLAWVMANITIYFIGKIV